MPRLRERGGRGLTVAVSKKVSYRRSREGDEEAVSRLIEGLFQEFIAPQYTAEGIEEFAKHMAPQAILKRYREGTSFAFLALEEQEVLGFIEVRDYNHIMLFFVREDHHRRGIARRLFALALDECLANNPELRSLTVNSSPYAVPIYERLGFTQTHPEQLKNGIRHTPMSYEVRGAKGP